MRAIAVTASGDLDGWERRVAPVVLLQIALYVSLTANLIRIPVISGGGRSLPILLNDIGVGLALSTAVLSALRRGRLTLDPVLIGAGLLAFVGVASASMSASTYQLSAFELLASLSYLVRWLFYFGVYVVVINFVRDRQLRTIWRALEGMMLLFVTFGIVQSLLLPDFALMVYPEARPYFDWDPQGNRLVSTVLEPNIAAAMIVIVLLVELALISSGERVSAWKVVILFAGLLLTLSRSGVAGFVTGGLVILGARGLNRRLLRWASGLGLSIMLALPVLIPFAARYSKLGVSDGSAAARLVSLKRALDIFLEHPIVGIGFNTFGFVQERRGFEATGGASYSSDGGLLFLAVMTGLVGVAIFLAMAWFVVRRSRRVWRDPNANPLERGICLGAVAATAAVIVHSVFVNSLFTTFVMQPLWVLWGLTYTAAAAVWKRRKPTARPALELLRAVSAA